MDLIFNFFFQTGLTGLTGFFACGKRDALGPKALLSRPGMSGFGDGKPSPYHAKAIS
jgi:hypothetical protein